MSGSYWVPDEQGDLETGQDELGLGWAISKICILRHLFHSFQQTQGTDCSANLKIRCYNRWPKNV